MFATKALGECLLLMLGACLYTFAAPPYEWASAAWLALAPLFFVIRDKTPWGAFFAGLLYGIFFCVGIAYWVYLAIAAYFPFPFPLDLLLTFLSYGFFVGSYTGFATALSCILMRSRHSLFCCLGVPALWVLGEFARSSLFSGFSWELLGYTQYRHLPLIQIADLTGVYGVSFLLALSGYGVAEVVSWLHRKKQKGNKDGERGTGNWELASANSRSSRDQFPWPALGCFTLSIALVLGYGMLRLSEAPSPSGTGVRIALVQGKVPSAQRWKRVHYANTLFHYVTLTQQGIAGTQPDLVVWPEFALGFYLDRELPLAGQLGQFTKTIGAALLLGAPRVEATAVGERYYNSAYLLAPGGAVLDVYDKIRLLPFAEYQPLAMPALVSHSFEQPSNFTAGQHSTVFSLPQADFGVLICYEATYPHLARRLTHNGAQFLVNISNDMWLAGAAAAAQHFSMAVFRAIENRRPLARVATAGIAGFVDPWGRVSQLSAASEQVTLGALTPHHTFSVYTLWGDWFVLGCGVWALSGLALSFRRLPFPYRVS